MLPCHLPTTTLPCPALACLQRQREEQAEWAAAAAELLRAHGHAPPAVLGRADLKRLRPPPYGVQPPLPAPAAVQQVRPVTAVRQPSAELGKAIASLEADVGALEQDWEARRAAQLSAAAQERAQWEERRAAEQAEWEARRAAEQAEWERQRRAEELAWRQAQQREQDAWLQQRQREERQWLEKRQRADREWQLQRRAQQHPEAEQQPRPQALHGAESMPALPLPPFSVPVLPSGSTASSHSGGSRSGNGAPPLPPVLEGKVGACGPGEGPRAAATALLKWLQQGLCPRATPPTPSQELGCPLPPRSRLQDSMSLDLLAFDSADFMEVIFGVLFCTEHMPPHSLAASPRTGCVAPPAYACCTLHRPCRA